MPPRPFLLAAALPDTGPAPDPDRLLHAARTAESWGLELVTIEPGPADALLVAARLAAQTARVGIVPVVAATSTEPFHVSTGLATIDVVARGRAGWVLTTEDPATVDGSVTWEVPTDAAGDAAEHLEAVRALWDSWEEGAVIRDAATDRFLDASKVHHVDLEGAHLSVRGPSITPRPPQGHPVVLVRAQDAATLRLGELAADVVLVQEGASHRSAERGASGGGALSGADIPDLRTDADQEYGRRASPTLLAAVDGSGRNAAERPAGPLRLVEVRVGPGEHGALADRVAGLHAAGADGVLLHADDLPGALELLVPALEAAGLRSASDRDDAAASSGTASAPSDGPSAPPDGPSASSDGLSAPSGAPPAWSVPDPPVSLRERLGLAPAQNRFEVPA